MSTATPSLVTSTRRTALLLILLSSIFLGCDSDSSGSGESSDIARLIGNYELVSIKDITGEITTQPDRTLFAGVPNPVTVDLGGGQTTEITFVLTGELVLSSTTFTSTINIESRAGGQTQTEIESVSGSWSIEGQNMTFIDTSETDIVSWTLAQGRLTLTSPETELVFQRR